MPGVHMGVFFVVLRTPPFGSVFIVGSTKKTFWGPTSFLGKTKGWVIRKLGFLTRGNDVTHFSRGQEETVLSMLGGQKELVLVFSSFISNLRGLTWETPPSRSFSFRSNSSLEFCRDQRGSPQPPGAVPHPRAELRDGLGRAKPEFWPGLGQQRIHMLATERHAGTS